MDTPHLDFESQLWGQGLRLVAGVDEAGRGALAGPVAAAALILPVDHSLPKRLDGVRDSKQMTPLQRERWAELLPSIAVAWGVGFASHQEIDDLGIVPATHLAVERALDCLKVTPEHLLLDYLQIPSVDCPQTPLVRGDATSLSIAAASVLAKTSRDALMRELNGMYPAYGFAAHKGYASQQHLEAITRLGPCAVHRMSFRPFRVETEQNGEV